MARDLKQTTDETIFKKELASCAEGDMHAQRVATKRALSPCEELYGGPGAKPKKFFNCTCCKGEITYNY